VLAVLRAVVEGPGPDRWLSPDLAAAEELIRSGSVVAAAAGAVPGGLR
jgi:histidine ammonia-lyase